MIVGTREPALRGYTVTQKVESLPELATNRVVLEARRGSSERANSERYFRVVEDLPLEAALQPGAAVTAARDRLVTKLIEAIAEYDAANPTPVVAP